MFFFEGSRCPVCDKKFTKDDDVVACPQCGAPHHRDCYKELGGCAFAEKHGGGYIWQPEAADADENAESANVCHFCGAENPQGRLYCTECGKQLFESRFPTGESGSTSSGSTAQGSWQAGSGYVSFGSEPTISDGELIENVPVGDIRRFIGSSSFYYIPLFVTFARYCRKISVNFIAFLTHGLWFISRKMYAVGGALLALQLGVFAYQCYCTTQLGDFAEVYASGNYVAAYNEVGRLIQERPMMLLGLAFSALLHYAVLFFSGLYGNRLYMSDCLKKIKKINGEAQSTEQFNSLLEQRGGTAMAVAIGCAVLYVALRMFLQSKIGV